MGSLARFALAPQWESICGVGFLDGLARQDKTRQDKTRQDKTRQDKTRQDKTRQDKTETIANENPDPKFTLNSDRHYWQIEIVRRY